MSAESHINGTVHSKSHFSKFKQSLHTETVLMGFTAIKCIKTSKNVTKLEKKLQLNYIKYQK